jgi:uncharacterized protein (TIGR02646 family)
MRESLGQMQKGRCAYCEGPLYGEAHIEHFKRKHDKHFPEDTFTWTNLFLSCESREHCGHYKDRRNAPPYSPDELVKPDEHQPDDFLFFHSSGEVRSRGGVDAVAAQQRADETIRVFHLNHPGLTAARRQAVERYLRGGGRWLDEVMTWPELELIEKFIAEEIQATQETHYSTTIRHFLESKSPFVVGG